MTVSKIIRPRPSENYVISSSNSGLFTTLNASFTDITNLSVSLTTRGRPVVLTLIEDPATGGGSMSSSGGANGLVRFVRDSTNLAGCGFNSAAGIVPVTTAFYIDFPSAGTYTYKAQGYAVGGATAFTCYYALLVAYEM